MANPNDLERLLAGDKNLEGADLSGVKLTKTDLREVDFSGADLSGADLSGSDLSKARLHKTKLRGAKLRKCKFHNENFEGVGYWTLQGADLSGSYFKDMFVEWGSADSATNLEGCTFDESYIWEFDGNPRVKANNCTFISPQTHQRFVNWEMKNCTFKKNIGGDVHFEDADLSGSDFSAVDWTYKLKYLDSYSNPSVYFEGADLEGVKGIPLPITDHFSHVGETVEEKARRVAEAHKKREEEARKKREEEARKKREEEEARKKREEEEARKKREEEARKKREEEEARKKREEEEARKKREEERIRRKTIQDVTKRVSRTRLDDKNLEDLAQEVGSLQAQPEYVKEYGKVLEELQEKIENNYSLLGKGIRNIKRIFRRFRRASQIRTASKMLKQLNKEISDLKKEL